LAELVAEIVGYQRSFLLNTSKLNGTVRKVMDMLKSLGLGWRPVIDLDGEITFEYNNYLEMKKAI